jgi:hypothetical protein
VTYRENPMAYEPPKFCNCNPRRKAPRWISWSGQNPGRRYYACVDVMVRGIFQFFHLFFAPLSDSFVLLKSDRMGLGVAMWNGMTILCQNFGVI